MAVDEGRKPDDPQEPADDVAVGGDPRLQPSRRIIAIGSGKGGAGKSLVAANVGIYLAQVGKRVLLVDADLGGANLHTFLGIDRPPMASGGDPHGVESGRLGHTVVETAVPGLLLLSGAREPYGIANLARADRDSMMARVREAPADYVILDVGAGTAFNVLDFFLLADTGIVIVTPEPTSIENAYRFLRAAFVRATRKALGRNRNAKHIVSRIVDDLGGLPVPIDLREAVARELPSALPVVDRLRASFRPKLVINQARMRADLELGGAIQSVVRRRMGVHLDYLGHIEIDDVVWMTTRRKKPLIIESPGAKASKNIERIVRRILTLESRERGRTFDPPKAPHELNHYEILEIDAGTSDEEVRRAHKRMREIYGRDSLATYSLYSGDEMEAAQSRIEDAYDTLIDPSKRKPYDHSLFPEGLPGEPRRGAPASEEAATAPGGELELTSMTEFTGSFLRRLREARGLDLREVVQKTKIGIGYLRAIEEEDFAALPAPVYTRGFVFEFAKCLRVDPAQATKSFMLRYRKARLELGGEAAKPER